MEAAAAHEGAGAQDWSGEMAVEIGQVAPDFTLMDGDRKEHTLSEYRGKTVVVAWYVLAFTGG